MTRLSRITYLAAVISVAIACGQVTRGRAPNGDGDQAGHESDAPRTASRNPAEASVSPVAPTAPTLEWSACKNGFECASAAVPRDYQDPEGPTITLAVTRLRARDTAHRIGSLFINYGGPGDPVLDQLHDGGGAYWAGKNPRFDIVGFDPRGVGHTPGAIDCQAHGDEDGPAPPHFVTPQTLDRDALERYAQHYVDACIANNDADSFTYTSTGNTARDLDLLRAAVGDEKLTYLGFSYGTVLGATYASLFPHNYRALVLDGGMDPDAYLNRPGDYSLDQTAAFEAELDRFLYACAANPPSCYHFGGDDPERAFDDLVAQANVTPIPVAGANQKPVNGEEILGVVAEAMYDKAKWRTLAAALAAASQGNATLVRSLSDANTAKFEPSDDQFFSLEATEQNWESDIESFIQRGERSWEIFPHFWWNSSYEQLALGLFPIHGLGAFRGPFHVPSEAATVLVVGNLHDPATPYRGAQVLTETLGNARLLTMNGDGHCSYGENSRCINAAVEAYLTDGTLPAIGAECEQEVPF